MILNFCTYPVSGSSQWGHIWSLDKACDSNVKDIMKTREKYKAITLALLRYPIFPFVKGKEKQLFVSLGLFRKLKYIFSS